MAEEHTIYGAGYGQVDWGDGYGMERDEALGLSCHFAIEFRTEHRWPQRIQPQVDQGSLEAKAAICRQRERPWKTDRTPTASSRNDDQSSGCMPRAQTEPRTCKAVPSG